MEWIDEAIVLSLRRHGETSGILEALTKNHGRHLGLVRGAAGKGRAILQAGNRLKLSWRARLEDHLGVCTFELERARAAEMFEDGMRLIGLNAFAAIASAVLPEREPHRAAYEGADALLDTISGQDFAAWAALFVRWEIGLLEELGYGLDLSRCAVTGTADDLVYVSPRTGRAVSRDAGAPYRERLFRLPAFLLGHETGEVDVGDVLAGLTLAAYFLEERVLSQQGRRMPDAALRLADLAGRLAESH